MTSELLRARAAALTDTRDHVGLHRVLRALELNTDRNYMEAYDAFATGLQAAPHGTVADVLRAAGMQNLDAIDTDLVTLEAADQARTRIYQRVGELHQLTQADAQSSDGAPIDSQTYGVVMSAEPVAWARLHEARQLSQGDYEGDAGLQRFAREDRDMATAGFDLVGGMRQAIRVQSAHQQAAAATRKLDSALAKGSTPNERRKLLTAAASEGLRQLDAAPTAARTGPGLQREARVMLDGYLETLEPRMADEIRRQLDAGAR